MDAQQQETNEPKKAESTDELPVTEPATGRPSALLRLLGFQPRKGRFILFSITPWGMLLWGFILFIGIGFAFAEYSMTPGFCRGCHIMEPYYMAWHESTHNTVPCGDCHFEPGWQNTVRGKFEASSQAVKYITDTYGSKPHAEVRDESCLRSGCHDHRLLEGLAEWQVTTQRGDTITIHFDHKPHLGELRRGKQLRCVSCHSQIVQGQHLVVTLDSCFACHFKGMKHGRDEEVVGGCGSCHGAPQKEIRLATGIFKHQEYLDRGVTCENCHSDVIKGDGEVPRQQCWNCHNTANVMTRFGETQFIHRQHVTEHKVECSSCHVQIEHHLNAGVPQSVALLGSKHLLEPSGACGQCHEQSHGGPVEMYRGVGGRGVEFMPSPMYLTQVDCIACHRKREYSTGVADVIGQTYIAAQERCDYCHGNRYEGVLDEWKVSIDSGLLQAEVVVARAVGMLNGAMDSMDPVRQLELRRLLGDAAHNIRFVKLGYGVHNATYATALLSISVDYATQVMTALGGEPKAPSMDDETMGKDPG